MHAPCSAICSSQLQPPIAMKTWYVWYSKVHTILVLLNLSTLAVITTCFLQCLYCSDSCKSTVQKDRATGGKDQRLSLNSGPIYALDLSWSFNHASHWPGRDPPSQIPAVAVHEHSVTMPVVNVLAHCWQKLCIIIVYSFFWNSLNCVSNLYSYNLTFCKSTTFRLALILKKSHLSSKY